MGKSDLNKQLGNNSRGAGGQQAGGISASEQQQQQLSPELDAKLEADARHFLEETLGIEGLI